MVVTKEVNLRAVDIVVITVIGVVITVSLITMSMMSGNKEAENFHDEQKNENLSEERFLATASEPVLVDAFNFTVNRVMVDDQVLVQSKITNMQDKRQSFVYIVQVKNSDGTTDLLSWINSDLPNNGTLNVAQSWIPKGQGQYEIEIFVWDSIEGRTVLSPARKIWAEVVKF